MSLLMARGGTPQVQNVVVTTAMQHIVFRSWSMFLKLRASAAVKVYFTLIDVTALNTNYITVPTLGSTEPYGEWSGPAEVKEIWVQTPTSTANLEICNFARLG